MCDLDLEGVVCKPAGSPSVSVAGKRRGVGDPRHLWPHVARIIGECEPTFVFIENVAQPLRLGVSEVVSGLVGVGYRLAAGIFTTPEKREVSLAKYLGCSEEVRVLKIVSDTAYGFRQ